MNPKRYTLHPLLCDWEREWLSTMAEYATHSERNVRLFRACISTTGSLSAIAREFGVSRTRVGSIMWKMECNLLRSSEQPGLFRHFSQRIENVKKLELLTCEIGKH
jgi:DNA-directed RNA polymerase sigma subunit (sigma70/sigma32)